MAYRHGQRKQRCLFPDSLDDYVSLDDPVRAYDAFVDAMDLDELDITWEPNKVGCPQYDPRVMLKILVYGYSYGIRSSRKLERALHHNVSFMWLAGALKPDFKTICRFRRDHRQALSKVLKQCARLCIELDLIAGNTLFVDGSKFRGNVSLKNLWTAERCERYLGRIDQKIEAILAECDAADERESDSGSLVQLQGELNKTEKLKAKVEGALEKLRSEQLTRFNTTDPDSAPERILTGEKSFRDIGTDDSHLGGSARFAFPEEPPLRKLDIAYVEHHRTHTVQ